MARTVTPLSDPKCEAAKPRDKDYTLFDGQGLFLLVKKNGSKIWRMKFKRPDGREGLATFGNYPALISFFVVHDWLRYSNSQASTPRHVRNRFGLPF
ncbi:hypothetical protein AA098_24170 [Pseudomonas sp. JY-Q]|nr:hypothetical protein AA098_24170 [Pseudomonas sp. JY-Q]